MLLGQAEERSAETYILYPKNQGVRAARGVPPHVLHGWRMMIGGLLLAAGIMILVVAALVPQTRYWLLLTLNGQTTPAVILSRHINETPQRSREYTLAYRYTVGTTSYHQAEEVSRELYAAYSNSLQRERGVVLYVGIDPTIATLAAYPGAPPLGEWVLLMAGALLLLALGVVGRLALAEQRQYLHSGQWVTGEIIGASPVTRVRGTPYVQVRLRFVTPDTLTMQESQHWRVLSAAAPPTAGMRCWIFYVDETLWTVV